MYPFQKICGNIVYRPINDKFVFLIGQTCHNTSILKENMKKACQIFNKKKIVHLNRRGWLL